MEKKKSVITKKNESLTLLMDELKEIVSQLESCDDLEESLAIWQKGSDIFLRASKRLNTIELKIKQVIDSGSTVNSDGEIVSNIKITDY